MEGSVLRKEGDDWVDGTASESIVAQVNFDKGVSGDESVANVLQSLWDLTDQTTGEDISKIGNLIIEKKTKRMRWSA